MRRKSAAVLFNLCRFKQKKKIYMSKTYDTMKMFTYNNTVSERYRELETFRHCA